MPDPRYQDGSFAQHLDGALDSLETALNEAGRSAATIRSALADIASLEQRSREVEERAREMEAAMTRARESLSLPFISINTAQPALRPVESWESETATGAPAGDPGQADEPVPGTTSHCLRLDVTSKSGSLDLKVVDSSVNENPAVVDVALLDYDGRVASLKIWVSEAEDPDEVREALLSSLQRRLGDEGDAEVRIDFDQESAA
jgi:hypothetical protein